MATRIVSLDNCATRPMEVFAATTSLIDLQYPVSLQIWLPRCPKKAPHNTPAAILRG
ncbi:hypothetical protein ACL02T_29730 [Pseudonocardia sp. RS010]|uniref:hypothetical protein n=1 Tax=Pseudonocardia sp. RS010 TaxID=3385979 RepID=UPI0039A013E9